MDVEEVGHKRNRRRGSQSSVEESQTSSKRLKAQDGDYPARLASLLARHHNADWASHARLIYEHIPMEAVGSLHALVDRICSTASDSAKSKTSSSTTTSPDTSQSFPERLSELLAGQEILLKDITVSTAFPRASLHLLLTAKLLILHTPLAKKTGKPVLIQVSPAEIEKVISAPHPNRNQQLICLVLKQRNTSLGSDLLLLHVPLKEVWPSKPANDDDSQGTAAASAPDPDPESASSTDFVRWFRGSVRYLESTQKPLHETLLNWIAHWNEPQSPTPLEKGKNGIKCYHGRSDGVLFPLNCGVLFVAGKNSLFYRMTDQLGRGVLGRVGQNTFDFSVVILAEPLERLTDAGSQPPEERTVEFTMIDREAKPMLEDYVMKIARAWNDHYTALELKQVEKPNGNATPARINDSEEDSEFDSDFSPDEDAADTSASSDSDEWDDEGDEGDSSSSSDSS